tara:strand:+ start:1393 stop:1974 length:582 start_codon:yes stop_codon:yes gene_type:complete
MRILTDVDGVLLNWEYAFNVWMKDYGYVERSKSVVSNTYDMGERYGISNSEKYKLIKMFNESAAIGFLPPLRDAIHYVQKLHKEHGYVFHVITSLSLDHNVQSLREQNLIKLFGEGVFEKFVYCDTGADKDDALEPYHGSGDIWIEDKIENAELGVKLGLDSVLIEHGHNMHHKCIPLMKNWKEVYTYVTESC